MQTPQRCARIFKCKKSMATAIMWRDFEKQPRLTQNLETA